MPAPREGGAAGAEEEERQRPERERHRGGRPGGFSCDDAREWLTEDQREWCEALFS
ncbi:hypothetical protein ACFV5N_17290 [Streptomyces sp. NPDC059853]|uniref:hypothetical protein n=1 Tax=Streptomyces sp. NPDC059853 TaxID=3346973 RepID=UPI003653138E